MRHIKEIAVAPLGALLCVCACLVGCERREAAPSSPQSAPKGQSAATPKGTSPTSIEARAKDKDYQAELQASIAAQRRTMAERAKIESRIAELRERARKALSEGATDAQVLAELENNPRKYPAWRELSAAMKANVAEEEKLKAVAQSALRQRILREKTGGGAQGASTAEK